MIEHPDHNTIRNLQTEIKKWADSVFPNRTSSGILKKIDEEKQEIIDSGCIDPLEYADLAILILDLASINGIDIQDAVRTKLEINYARSWEIDLENGVMRHKK